jgi:threonylcarbamoyladenosine tRNA methylthiotransferase MtaB
LISALVESNNAAPHLHLSLQSGDDDILVAMQRPYNTDYFRCLVEQIRESIPDIGLTTDVIVGFPGETEERFQNTLEFCREMNFARTHVFRYSPRQRTYADRNLLDDVPYETKERRHRLLTQVSVDSQARFASMWLGKTVKVLVEGRGMKEGWMAGYTGNYVRTHFPCPKSAHGTIVDVEVHEINDDGDAIGHLSDERSDKIG